MNILFLMTDQHRTDHVSFLPGARMATPNIDRIAATAGFSNCVSVNPVCTPARCALLTGKYSHQIGMLAMSGDLAQDHPTYARALQAAGYWTAAVGKLHWLQGWPWSTPRGQGFDLVKHKADLLAFGFDHIWETSGKQLAMKNYCDYAAHLGSKGLLDAYRDHIESRGGNFQDATQTRFTGEPWPFDEADYVDNMTGERILDAIRNRPAGKPFCIFGSFCGPHKPYDPPRSAWEATPHEEVDDFIGVGQDLPAEVKARLYRLRRSYQAMITTIDIQVGRVLDLLEAEGLADDTLVIFTADHGEMLGDHGRMSKLQTYRQSAVVPTAIRVPGRDSRALIDAPVELTDLTATMLDYAGFDPQTALSKPWPAFHDRVPCRSLRPYLEAGPQAVGRSAAFSECYGNWQMLRSDRWQYVRRLAQTPGDHTREELYDLQADPETQHNIAAAPEHADTLAGYRRQLADILDATPAAQLAWMPFGDK